VKTIHQDRYGQLIAVLVQQRKALKKTQVQLAEQLGKPQSYVAKVEGLDRKLDIVEFVDWCHMIGINASAVIIEQFESSELC
jgi:predicted transcriptional regulator